jgi:hypothetical protein
MMYNQELRNRTLGPLEGRGGYSAVHIPAGHIAPIGTQWHVFYLPLSLNTILRVLKKNTKLYNSEIYVENLISE